MPKLMGSLKIKADKEYKAGDEISLDDVEVDVPQENFDRQISGRLAREKKKIEGLEAELAEARETAAKGGKKDEPVNKEADERIAKLEKALAEQMAESKRLRLKDRVSAVVKAKAAELPEEFRDLVQVSDDATDDEIASAVEKVNERFTALKTKLGVTNTTAKKEDVGVGGQGGTKDDPNDKRLPLMEKAKKNVPARLEFLKNQGLDQEGMLKTLESWDKNGELEPKKA